MGGDANKTCRQTLRDHVAYVYRFLTMKEEGMTNTTAPAPWSEIRPQIAELFAQTYRGTDDTTLPTDEEVVEIGTLLYDFLEQVIEGVAGRVYRFLNSDSEIPVEVTFADIGRIAVLAEAFGSRGAHIAREGGKLRALLDDLELLRLEGRQINYVPIDELGRAKTDDFVVRAKREADAMATYLDTMGVA
jgi:hypothetical protein